MFDQHNLPLDRAIRPGRQRHSVWIAAIRGKRDRSHGNHRRICLIGRHGTRRSGAQARSQAHRTGFTARQLALGPAPRASALPGCPFPGPPSATSAGWQCPSRRRHHPDERGRPGKTEGPEVLGELRGCESIPSHRRDGRYASLGFVENPCRRPGYGCGLSPRPARISAVWLGPGINSQPLRSLGAAGEPAERGSVHGWACGLVVCLDGQIHRLH